MPVSVVLYQDESGERPVLTFLRRESKVVRRQAVQHLELLRALGHRLRRPYCDNLGSGLWELRWRVRKVHYRILYFFDGQTIVVLVHSLTKKGVIPVIDIVRAQQRKAIYYANPGAHAYPFPVTLEFET